MIEFVTVSGAKHEAIEMQKKRTKNLHLIII